MRMQNSATTAQEKLVGQKYVQIATLKTVRQPSASRIAERRFKEEICGCCMFSLRLLSLDLRVSLCGENTARRVANLAMVKNKM